MPHLTLQISPGGPLIDLTVGVSVPRAQALRKSAQPIPSPVQLRGLIDTGASGTCIDAPALHGLGLAPTGQIPVHTPSTGTAAHVSDQYDVSLTLLHPRLNLHLGATPVIASHLSAQGIQALIGRDVLSQCLFVYDGMAGIFSLAF